MVQLNGERMEQWIAEAEKNVPVPMPANMKESVMQYVERKQRMSGVRRSAFYHMKLCAAACMALVMLAGTAAGLQWQEQIFNGGIYQESGVSADGGFAGYDAMKDKKNAAGSVLFEQFCQRMDAFASVMNEKMNEIVKADSQDNQGGK